MTISLQSIRIALDARLAEREQQRRRAEDRIREELRDARAITIRAGRVVR